MAYKEVFRVEIAEIIRRWQAGESRRHIASGTGLSKDTVGKYIASAERLGVVRDGPAPSEEQLGRLATISRPGPRQAATPIEAKLAPWADHIYQWLTGDRLQMTRIQELLRERDCRVSYTSVKGGVTLGHGVSTLSDYVRLSVKGKCPLSRLPC